MKFSGTLRVFFNVHNEAPRVWCIRNGDGFEVAVCEVVLDNVIATSRYQKRGERGQHDTYGEPSAWFEVVGTCEVDDSGRALIWEG